MIFAFAGIVAFHKGGDYRAQRFDMLKAKAEQRSKEQQWTVEGPDEGLIGI